MVVSALKVAEQHLGRLRPPIHPWPTHSLICLPQKISHFLHVLWHEISEVLLQNVLETQILQVKIIDCGFHWWSWVIFLGQMYLHTFRGFSSCSFVFGEWLIKSSRIIFQVSFLEDISLAFGILRSRIERKKKKLMVSAFRLYSLNSRFLIQYTHPQMCLISLV